ncbi:DHH family phosphoesterase [Lapidilactobacillus gannanensis]|jgi:c-di-AMP phosphodiesterase-like protein|uniref:Cyclic-di-AMP phosphodiesterase n=1 Tax=Lapidilactobacillus gannanensis TaxID=2486002 RepID=A0ABW4BJL3_9LACO|nr:DHH family phosphoesterase [Lapidilactobacillus gannanensis]MCH4057565.1 DHH family phosphoesterase [Lactobacillaceae bacterium]
MKKFINFLRNKFALPTFFADLQLRVIALTVLGIAIAASVIALIIEPIFGLIFLVAIILLVGVIFYGFEVLSKNTNQYVSDLSYRIKRGEQEALIQMPIGIMLFDTDYEIQWVNPTLQKYLGDRSVLGRKIKDVDPDLATLIEQHQEDDVSRIVDWDQYKFEITLQAKVGALYLLDVTHSAKIEQRFIDQQIVIGQIFIDNYDEITQTMDDQGVSNLSNYLTNRLSNWASRYEMFLKRVDEDHFFVLAYAQSLAKAEKNKFQILDRIREDTSAQNFPITLSVGFAYGSDDLADLAVTSQNNLDLALGRGGDQVVVRAKGQQARFYGGKTNPMEKRTRVRARMISQALQGLFTQVQDIYVMGHNHPDMDAIGSSLGIRRIAQMNNVKCHIVLDQSSIHSDVQRLVAEIKRYPDLIQCIVTPEQALASATAKSMLIMVDHSKPSISISPELYHKLEQRVVIIDHHRRGEEFPENPMLTYIEPYASSTCELITEIFEYQPTDAEPLNKIEATAMLAGISVDTQSFSQRTGTRTFDAASYLRSVGADNSMVQRLLKENADDFIQRNHLIDGMEMVKPRIALAVGEEGQAYDPVIAAQAADTILRLAGIDASFVISRRVDNVIAISARSLGDFNVQIIMEKMGGGGHLSNAATQLKDTTIEEAKQQLITILDQQDQTEQNQQS